MNENEKSTASSNGKKRGGLRLLTWLMIVVIAATSVIDAFCIYNIFGKGPKDTMAAAEISEEQLLIQEEDANEKKARSEAAAKGIISYKSANLSGKSDVVITDSKSAVAALGALKAEFGIDNPEDEFKLRYVNEGKLFDTYALRQMISGYPVFGHDVKVVADKRGNLISIAGNYFNVAEEELRLNENLSQSDVKDEVAKYLKSEYKLSEDKDYSLSNSGSWIVIDEDKQPRISYAYIVYDKTTDNAVQNIIAAADNGEILVKSDCIGKQNSDFSTYQFREYEKKEEIVEKETETQDETETDTDEQSETSEETETETEEETESEETSEEETEEETDEPTKEKLLSDVFDEDNGVYVYADLDEYGYTPAKEDNKKAVELLAEAKTAIEFFEKNYEREHLEEYYILVDNASAYQREHLRIVSFEDELTIRYEESDIDGLPGTAASAFLADSDANDVAREYTKAILPYDIADDSVFSAAISDIFAEFIEDYSNGGFNGSCNWETGDPSTKTYRDMKNPSSSGDAVTIADTSGKTSGLSREELLHDSTVISHSAYLMTQENNGQKALSNEQVAYIYYTAIPFVTTDMTYDQFRDLITSIAMNFRNNKDVPDKFALNDSQIMNIINAFDAVGISRSGYVRMISDAYSSDTKFTIYNADSEKYGECHLSVKRSSDGEVLIDKDLSDPVFSFEGLEPGIYDMVITDLNNNNISFETNGIIVNKDTSDNKAGEYKTSENLRTKIGSLKRSVVLVLDTSGSMSGTPIKETILAAEKFVDYVLSENPCIDISIVPYSDYATTAVVSSSDRDELITAIEKLRSNGGTNMYDGIDKANEILKESDSDRKLLFVMSDGFPESGPVGDDGTYDSAIRKLATEVKDTGVIMYSLGFFHKLDGYELQNAQKLMTDIASPGYAYNVKTSEDMAYAFNDLADNVGGKYSIVVRIACPVDVTVKCSGEVLCSDPDELSTRASFGSLGFEGENNEIKVLRLDNDTDYEICINGTGEGTMDYSISFADDEGEYSDVRTFSDIPISKGTIISTNTKSSGKTVLDVDDDGDGKFDESYVAGKNGNGKVKGKAVKTAAAIIIGILLTVFVILECVFAYRRSKKNKVCRKCGGAVGKDTRFCRVCGEEVHRVPLWLPETEKREKQSATVITAKLVAMGICMLITLSVVTIYRSAATTVFKQLRDQELVSAEKLYDGSVSDSGIQKKYLSFLTKRYIKQVNSKCGSGDFSETSADAIYDSVFQMDMGGASDLADDYLKEHGIEAVRKPKKEKTESTSENDIYENEEPTTKKAKTIKNRPF